MRGPFPVSHLKGPGACAVFHSAVLSVTSEFLISLSPSMKNAFKVFDSILLSATEIPLLKKERELAANM